MQIMEFVFAYAAGLLTLINPCVLPVLPIVLATALQASRWGPVALAAGMSLSFVGFGLAVTAFGHLIGLSVDLLSQIGAGLMVVFGVMLLVPRFSGVLATATAGLSARADAGMDHLDRKALSGQFLGGVLLGTVWSPCIGPTLGGAIALASPGRKPGARCADHGVLCGWRFDPDHRAGLSGQRGSGAASRSDARHCSQIAKDPGAGLSGRWPRAIVQTAPLR